MCMQQTRTLAWHLLQRGVVSACGAARVLDLRKAGCDSKNRTSQTWPPAVCWSPHVGKPLKKKTYPGYLFQSFIEIQEQGWACSEIASKQQTIRLPHLALPAIWMLRIDDGWKYPSAWDCQHPRCKWTLQCNITGKHQLAANVRLA